MYLSLVYAYRHLFPQRAEYKSDSLIIFVVFFLLWESFKLSYAGYFSLADIAIGVMFPHMFSLALFVISTSLFLQILQSFQLNAKVNMWSIALISIMNVVIVLSHVITGVSLYYTYFCLIAYYLVLAKPRVQFKQLLPLLVIPAVSVVGALTWPYYSFLEPFIKLKTIHTEEPVVAIFEFPDWIAVAGTFFIALFGFRASKQPVLFFWFVGLLFIVASYLYPIRISSYWRFFPSMLLPLGFVIVNWLSELPNTFKIFYMSFILLFGIGSFINKVDTIGYRTPTLPQTYAFLKIVPKDKLIFSDAETSYIFSGITGNPVLGIPTTHWNPSNTELATIRNSASSSFWNDGKGPGNLTVLKEYEIEYVLINKRIFRNYDLYVRAIGKTVGTKELYSDDSYILLRLDE